jgi:hypothetical protein
MKTIMVASLYLLATLCIHGQVMMAKSSGKNEFNAPDTLPGSIIFPNAFRWNGTGPTGGYWNESVVEDFVFRPVCRNVEKYKLQIFNRLGLLIFESSDIHTGWDGYLKNGQLAFQGVYIWRASGKFNDESSFSLTGDVTFLY